MVGLFIDGIGLDRATRRLKRKVEMSALVRGVTSGIPPVVARYYTLVPYEDDSRQRAFLDAVARAPLSVVVKRLPPKGVTRQVSTDVEMAADIVAFALGHSSFSELGQYQLDTAPDTNAPAYSIPLPLVPGGSDQVSNNITTETLVAESKPREERVVVVVCPTRDLSYPIALVKELGVDTITADFGQFNNGDVLKSAAKWIDLSDSETIWRE